MEVLLIKHSRASLVSRSPFHAALLFLTLTETWQLQCIWCPMIAAQHAERYHLISSLGSLPFSSDPPAASHCTAACVASTIMGAWLVVTSPTWDGAPQSA